MMRNQTIFCFSFSTLVLAALAPAGTGQQPAASQAASDQPALTLHVQAREVLLPVTVRDKHGALVTNLQKSDFTLTEDGRPQVIKSFARETNLPFRLGLLVDTSRSMTGAMEDERKAAGKFVDLMLPGATSSGTATGSEPAAGGAAAVGKDQAFLLHFDHEVELLEDFTGSRDKLHKELDDMGPTPRSEDERQGPETTGDDRDIRRAAVGGAARSSTTRSFWHRTS